jgi:hypothetical protein
VKTAPNPLVVAGVLLPPGMKKSTSVMLLPMALNSRRALNVLKMVPYVGLLNRPASPAGTEPDQLQEEPARTPSRSAS